MMRILKRPIRRWPRIKNESLRHSNYPKLPLEMRVMKRGEVWWVNFDPSTGGEIKKTRPAIILSNDISNKYLNRVQVVPLTSSTDRLYPSEAYVIVNEEARQWQINLRQLV